MISLFVWRRVLVLVKPLAMHENIDHSDTLQFYDICTHTYNIFSKHFIQRSEHTGDCWNPRLRPEAKIWRSSWLRVDIIKVRRYGNAHFKLWICKKMSLWSNFSLNRLIFTWQITGGAVITPGMWLPRTPEKWLPITPGMWLPITP